MAPQSPRPRKPSFHAGAGSKTSFVVGRYAGRVPRGAREVKLSDGQEAALAAATSSAICARSASTLGNFRSSRSRRVKVKVTCRSEEHTPELQSPYDLVCR